EMPLYYHMNDAGDLCVASEMKQLIAVGAPLKSIEPAKPGVLYRLTENALQSGAYHEWSFTNDQTSWDRRELRDLIEASVAKRVASNTMQKSAVLLSGGLDSSIIAYELSKLGVKDAFTVATDENATDFVNAEF